MSKRFHVAFPEAGEGVHLHFDMEAWQTLYDDYGPEWHAHVLAGIDRYDPAVVARCLALFMKGGDPEGFPWGLTFDEVANRVFDAISLPIKGKTFSQLTEEAEARRKELQAELAALTGQSLLTDAEEEAAQKTTIIPD